MLLKGSLNDDPHVAVGRPPDDDRETKEWLLLLLSKSWSRESRPKKERGTKRN